jgi:septum site-determining protein MinC
LHLQLQPVALIVTNLPSLSGLTPKRVKSVADVSGAPPERPGSFMSSRSSPLSFEIKSATLPLVSVLIKSLDLATLSADMQHRFGDNPDFFDNDAVLLDLQSAEGILDMRGLLLLLRQYRLNPVALCAGNATHEAAATLAGLFISGEARVLPASNGSPTEIVREVFREVEVVREVAGSGQTALVVDKPLRSGQQVYARGRDLVVLAMVNPGAEVMADGHIHVYAPLRGKAIAGAKGDTTARIFAASLEAELVSIAGVYRTSDTPLPKEVAGQAAQVWLADDKLVMRAL